MPSVRCLASDVDCLSACGVVVPCVSPSQSSSRSSSGSSGEIILRLQDLVSGQVPADVVLLQASGDNCRARRWSSDSIDVGRNHFGSAGHGVAVSTGTSRFIRLGCCGAVSRTKEKRSRSLPGISPCRRTSGVGEDGVAFVGADRPGVASVASPVPSDSSGRPCTSPDVGGAASVGMKHGASPVVGSLGAPDGGSYDDVGVPMNLVIDVGCGAVLASYFSDSCWRSKRCAVCGPCHGVGAVDERVLSSSGGRCHECRSKDVDSARVLTRSVKTRFRLALMYQGVSCQIHVQSGIRQYVHCPRFQCFIRRATAAMFIALCCMMMIFLVMFRAQRLPSGMVAVVGCRGRLVLVAFSHLSLAHLPWM